MMQGDQPTTRATPHAFRDLLISIARTAKPLPQQEVACLHTVKEGEGV